MTYRSSGKWLLNKWIYELSFMIYILCSVTFIKFQIKFFREEKEKTRCISHYAVIVSIGNQ